MPAQKGKEDKDTKSGRGIIKRPSFAIILEQKHAFGMCVHLGAVYEKGKRPVKTDHGNLK